jgi:hypothetical protein
MVYDAARQQVVLFGGYDGSTRLSDTWVWDGVGWTEKFPATSSPPRGGYAMAYDAARQQVVIFGGAAGPILGDTWVWDGTNWIQKFPANSPSVRTNSAMAYDAARQQVVLFGGSPGSPTGLGDTWVWDGTNWIQKFPATSPPARAAHDMAYDAARGEVVMFGGTTDGSTVFNDTWVWNGTNWTQKFPLTTPPPKWHHRVAYDAALQRVVLFGGLGPNGSPFYNDTWEWDGANWVQQFPATSPPSRYLHAMAYDGARTQIVVFGGFTGISSITGWFTSDTWVWGTSASIIEVAVDIKPGSDPNSINLSSAGNIPAAILSEPGFDAPSQADPDSLRLAGAGVNLIGKSGRFQCSGEDVNADGLVDLVCHFDTSQFVIEAGQSIAVLEGKTFGGSLIRGEDSISIVPD